LRLKLPGFDGLASLSVKVMIDPLDYLYMTDATLFVDH